MSVLFIKNNFLQLTIHRQIQIGIISVSFCVFFLTFLILSINGFILINLTYTDISSIVDAKETQQMEMLAQYTDLVMNIKTDTSKTSVQWIRNFIQNYKRNFDFIQNMPWLDYTKFVKNIDSLIDYEYCNNGKMNDCIFYKNMGDNNSVYESTSFKNHLKIMAFTIPLIKNTFNHRIKEDFVNPIFHTITIYSNVFKTVFVYVPKTNTTIDSFFNKYYNLTWFNTYQRRAAKSIADNYIGVALKINYVPNPLDTNKTILKNPTIQFINPIEKIDFPYKNPFFQNGVFSALVTTTSGLYGYNVSATYANLNNTNNIIDIVQGDWSINQIDYISFNAVKQYKGIKIIVTDSSKYTLVTASSCHYFIKFYQNLNQINDYSNKNFEMPLTIRQCFKYEEGLNKFNQFFNNTNFLIKFKRKTNIKLLTDYQTDFYNFPYFKIISLFSPDFATLAVLNSDFFVNIVSIVFVIKNENYLDRSIYPLKISLIAEMFMMMFYNLVIWFLCIFCILIIVIKETSDITRPINELVSQVTEFGRGDLISANASSAEKKKILFDQRKALEAINYPADKDINEMFQICKSLIRGGFTEHVEEKNKIKNSFSVAFNNVTFVKTNNLIINDEILVEKFNNYDYIFNWVKSEVIINNENQSVLLDDNDSSSDVLSWTSPINRKISMNYSRLSVSYTKYLDAEVLDKEKESQINLITVADLPVNPNNTHDFISKPRSSSNNKCSFEASFLKFIDNLDNQYKETPKNYLHTFFMKATETTKEEDKRLKIVKF